MTRNIDLHKNGLQNRRGSHRTEPLPNLPGPRSRPETYSQKNQSPFIVPRSDMVHPHEPKPPNQQNPLPPNLLLDEPLPRFLSPVAKLCLRQPLPSPLA